MRTTRSVYLIRGTDNVTAADRFDTLAAEIAGVAMDSLARVDLAVTDAILLRATEELDPETQVQLERELAALLGDDVGEEEEKEEDME